MAEYTAYPLSWPIGWPRNRTRVTSRFGTSSKRVSVAYARDAVIRELHRAGVPDWRVVVSSNVTLRRDGLPYSNQREPDDTGVAVYWKNRKDKQLVLACDKYNTVGDNLYAIAKTIEATRGIERWGSVTAEQAFEGYARLPEKTSPSCWEVLGLEPPLFPITPIRRPQVEKYLLDAYRVRARETHPDHGGSSEAFAAVVAAKDTALQLIK